MSFQEQQTIHDSSSNFGTHSQVTTPLLETPSPHSIPSIAPPAQVTLDPSPPLFSQSIESPSPCLTSPIIPPPPPPMPPPPMAPPTMPPSHISSMTPSLISPLRFTLNSKTPNMDSDKSTQTTKQGGLILEKIYSSLEKESRKACNFFRMRKGFTDDSDCPYLFLSHYHPVTPVIQSGPICGLVALTMASEIIGGQRVTTEDIFEEAKVKFYTKQGEMFSALAVSDLASHFLCCDVECIQLNRIPTTQMLDGREIIRHLLKGNLVLIPYDADRNHGPCQKRGHKAHWALLTGFFAAMKINEAPEDLTIKCEMDSEIPSLYYWSNLMNEPCSDKIMSLMESNTNTDFFVFGHHGKSKYAGLWSLSELLLSNDNLVEAGPERNSEEYILPHGGVEAGLKSQIVVLKHVSSLT